MSFDDPYLVLELKQKALRQVTSVDSSSELLNQTVVDVICAMDGRHILLKPPPLEERTDRQMNKQTYRRTDR